MVLESFCTYHDARLGCHSAKISDGHQTVDSGSSCPGTRGRPGARVLIHVGNRVTFAEYMLAVLRVAAIVVSVGVQSTAT